MDSGGGLDALAWVTSVHRSGPVQPWPGKSPRNGQELAVIAYVGVIVVSHPDEVESVCRLGRNRLPADGQAPQKRMSRGVLGGVQVNKQPPNIRLESFESIGYVKVELFLDPVEEDDSSTLDVQGVLISGDLAQPLVPDVGVEPVRDLEIEDESAVVCQPMDLVRADL